MLQNNDTTIPPNATSQNWLNSIPSEFQTIIAAYTTYPYQNGTSIGAGNGDLRQVVVFYIQPQWHYCEQASTVKLDVGLTYLGEGGEVAWSCDNDSPVCTGTINYYSAGISAFNLKLKVVSQRIDREVKVRQLPHIRP